MKLQIFAAVTIFASITILAGPANSSDLEVALLIQDIEGKVESRQTCGEGIVAADSCQPKIQIAAGAECPANSGSYCSDELPYCCGTPGNYYCAKNVNGC
ncbi:MAG: hypothetical protein AAF362_05430 [Pseudomonadota bacterium]